MNKKMENHPCFNDKARHTFGRIHLPVAPKCNIQCNFCDRKFDCINESRPGVSSTVLSPKQALSYLNKVTEKKDNIAVVGIAGPGDPFANADETMETLRLIRNDYPEMLLCVATNGLNLLEYIDELAELEVSHVTITINAIDPEIGKEIYSWVRYKKRMYRGLEAAELMLSRQLEAIKKLKEVGITAKVNTIIIPGINQDHVIDVAKKVAELGADILNPIPLLPTTNTLFKDIPEPSKESVLAIRKEAETYLPQMHHCTRCRADAVGLLGEKQSAEVYELLASSASEKPVAVRELKVAVASREGLLVNQHMGEAAELLIYEKGESAISCTEKRETPEPGGGEERWKSLAEVLSDCSHILVSGIGENPKSILAASGIEVLVIEGLIEDALKGIFSNQSIDHMIKRTPFACGSSCSGTAAGCG